MGLFSKDKPSKEEIMRNGGLVGHAKKVYHHHTGRDEEVGEEQHNCFACHKPMTYRGGAWFCTNRKCRF